MRWNIADIVAAMMTPDNAMSFLVTIIPFVLIWSLVWKGLALWKAAHEESKPWFIALLVINTAGILEILYIFVFAKRKGLK
ncbi:MAG: DUF5652 family protein [Patescibacteria group bacterium]